jgi:hypothetical protein
MGGGFSFNFKFSSGSSGPAAGRVVGQSGEDLIEVEMRGVEGVPDGIYSAPSRKGTAIKAVLNLDGTNVKTENIKKTITEEDAIDISTLQVAAQPSGWTPRNTADDEPKEWSSEDGFVVRQFADSYVAYDTDTAGNPANEIARGESWADIQKAIDSRSKSKLPAEPEKTEATDTAPDVPVADKEVEKALPSAPAPSAVSTPAPTVQDSEPISSTLPSDQIKDIKEAVAKFTPTAVEGSRRQDEFGNTVWDILDTYKINGETVAFVNAEKTDIDTTGMKVLPINPYEISGKSMDSKEGQDIAEKWFAARAATKSSMSQGSSDIEALLYAGINGDQEAMAQFEAHAAEGKKLIEQIKKDRIDSIELSSYNKAAVEERFAQTGGEPKVEDLFLVRQVSFEPEFDDDGNLTMYPVSNYDVDRGDGTMVRVPRTTIHFTLNHAVEQHMMWQPGENDYIIVAPLKDFIDSNPDSIDNLYAIDTFATPKPGKPLTIPKDSFKIIKADKDASARQKDVFNAIEEMGGTYMFSGGSHYSHEEGVDAAVSLISKQLGLNPGIIHANHPSAQYENALYRAIGEDGESIQADWNAWIGSQLSKNAMLNLAAMSAWSGVGQGMIYNSTV